MQLMSGMMFCWEIQKHHRIRINVAKRETKNLFIWQTGSSLCSKTRALIRLTPNLQRRTVQLCRANRGVHLALCWWSDGVMEQ